METLIQKPCWVVIGATQRKDKFGYKIFKHMIDKGYRVYPVNPNFTEIDGITCYKSVLDLPEVPDVADFVVPEAVGLKALDECKEKGIPAVWLQPGADKPAVVAKAQDLGFKVVQDCVLVQIK